MYSKSVKKADEGFKKWMFDDTGYNRTLNKEGQIIAKTKSRTIPDATIYVSVKKEGNRVH